MDIMECILRIYPDWKGVVWNNTYAGIKPHELETRPIPTLEQLQTVWPQIQADQQAAIDAAVSCATEVANDLPSWSQVDTAITAIGTLADAKVFMRKLARVLYIHIKNSGV